MSDVKPKKYSVSFLVSLLTCAALFFFCLRWIPTSFALPDKEWHEIRIASEGARPPFNFLDQNGELAGFEIELGRELCARMQVKCIFVQKAWDDLIPALLSDKVDAIMAALEKTEERVKKIDFSRPYVRMPSAFLAKVGTTLKEATPSAFVAHTIGVQANGPHQAYLTDVFPQSIVKSYATLEEAILDLAEGRVEAVLGDEDAIQDFLKVRPEAKCCQILAELPPDPAFFGEGIAVGLRNETPELKKRFNLAIESVIRDGTYAKIRSKYFDFELM